MSSVVVNPGNIVRGNLLSIGFQCDWERWIYLVQSPMVKQYAKEMNPKIIRAFDFRARTPYLRPCSQWNEATKTGTWNWTNVDAFTDAIFEIGAEPLYCFAWPGLYTQSTIPLGMALNPATLLPYPDSFAAYASEWVRHFKQTGRPVRFYEIFNEPGGYFSNGVHTYNENLASFIQVWAATAQAMRQENPNIQLSHDQTETMSVLQYWIANNGSELDSINFHKYDSETVPGRTDDDVFNRAESQHYAVALNAQSYYHTQRGRIIPIMDTESNLSWAWETGTDPRLQQMAGGIWLALSLRTAMLNGVNCNIYYELCNPKSTGTGSGGWGFGMMDSGSSVGAVKTRWIPYYVNLMFGKNLAVGDPIVQTSTSDTGLRVIAWTHEGTLNIILINKTHTNKQVAISGITANLDYKKLDETTDAANPALQTGVYSSSNVPLNGYTVILLQTPKQAQFFFRQWQDGDTNPTKTIMV